jgi:hypothetical protein
MWFLPKAGATPQKKIKKNLKKTLDKPSTTCYNEYRKQERK